MEKEELYILEALKEARKAEAKDEVPVGCVLVEDGKIIARAHNLRESKKRAIAHAEILAIEKACKKKDAWRLENVEMYVTLEPCSMCAGAILQSRIKKVVFGAYDEKGGALGSSYNLFEQKNLNHHPEIIGGILKEKCSIIIKNYFKNKRK